MKASALINHPFLIPVGTKLALTAEGKREICFFAGYLAFSRTLVNPDIDIFAVLKTAHPKDGRQTRHDLHSAKWSRRMLENFEMEVLKLPNQQVFNPNKYNSLICRSVVACTREMVTLAFIYGIKRIEFKDYPQIDTPYVIFNCNEIAEYADVKALVFDSDYAPIIIEGKRDWTAYLDYDYGDYFDVAHSVGKIYNAFIEVIKTLQNKENN